MAFTQVRGHADARSGLDRCRVSMHRVRRARTLRSSRTRQAQDGQGTARRARRTAGRPDDLDGVPRPASRFERREAGRYCWRRDPPNDSCPPARRAPPHLRPLGRPGRGRGAGPLRMPADVPAADDGALPAGRRRGHHPGRGQGERPRDHLQRQGPAGRPVGADRQQRRPAGDRHHLRAGGARGHQAGRAQLHDPPVGRVRDEPRHAALGVGRAGLPDEPHGRHERRRQQRGRCARAGAEPVLLDPDPRRVVRRAPRRARLPPRPPARGRPSRPRPPSPAAEPTPPAGSPGTRRTALTGHRRTPRRRAGGGRGPVRPLRTCSRDRAR